MARRGELANYTRVVNAAKELGQCSFLLRLNCSDFVPVRKRARWSRAVRNRVPQVYLALQREGTLYGWVKMLRAKKNLRRAAVAKTRPR